MKFFKDTNKTKQKKQKLENSENSVTKYYGIQVTNYSRKIAKHIATWTKINLQSRQKKG